MKRQLSVLVYPVIAALSLAAAVAAHAESPTVDRTAAQVWSQTKTRDQVRAELLQARADGSLKVWSTGYYRPPAARSLRSRDDVRAELFARRVAENGNPMVGEDSGSFYLAQHRPVREAAPVLAQAQR